MGTRSRGSKVVQGVVDGVIRGTRVLNSLDGDVGAPGPVRIGAQDTARVRRFLGAVTPALNAMAKRREDAPDGTLPTLHEDAAHITRLARNEGFGFLNPGDPVFMIRQQILDLLVDPKHEIDKECGYPNDITPLMYHLLSQRDGIAKRVVRLEPQESWAMDPWIYETQKGEQTEFEAAWDSLLKRINAWHWLHRIDEMSGVGRFGVLLLGLNDDLPYDQPAGTVGLDGLVKGPARRRGKKLDLIFLRAFEEVAVQVLTREANPKNPRFGQPLTYLLTFRELDVTEPVVLGSTAGGMSTATVHWTRVLHVADNREMSEIFGNPRLKAVWNRVVDLRKIMGGSGEMFWKGAFPGISFEMQPGANGADLDMESLQEQMENYQRGLQRYLAVAGLTAKSLSPQTADPKNHVDCQMDQIACSLGIPKRVLFGSEEAKLSSNQDAATWNKRLARRQDKYLSPMLVRPFVDRLVDLGVLPRPEDGYEVWWPDLNTSTDQEKADLVFKRVQAAQAYLLGGVDRLIPPKQFLDMLLDMDGDAEQADDLMKAREAYLRTRADEFAPQDPTVASTGMEEAGEEDEEESN